MNIEEYIESAEKENRLERYHCNSIDFYLVTGPDGWVSVLRCDCGIVRPLIQARTRNYALRFCELTELINAPIDRL